jgi:hypothetical protein
VVKLSRPSHLTHQPVGRYRLSMAQSILIFDFGTNEEAAQQARHKIESWTQAFRLGKKILLKFEREEPEANDGEAAKPSGEKKKSHSKEGEGSSAHIKLLVRLDFSDHEKLTAQRWLDRIPTEEPFKSMKSKIVHHSDASFDKTSGLFDSLS